MTRLLLPALATILTAALVAAVLLYGALAESAAYDYPEGTTND